MCQQEQIPKTVFSQRKSNADNDAESHEDCESAHHLHNDAPHPTTAQVCCLFVMSDHVLVHTRASASLMLACTIMQERLPAILYSRRDGSSISGARHAEFSEEDDDEEDEEEAHEKAGSEQYNYNDDTNNGNDDGNDALPPPVIRLREPEQVEDHYPQLNLSQTELDLMEAERIRLCVVCV